MTCFSHKTCSWATGWLAVSLSVKNIKENIQLDIKICTYGTVHFYYSNFNNKLLLLSCVHNVIMKHKNIFQWWKCTQDKTKQESSVIVRLYVEKKSHHRKTTFWNVYIFQSQVRNSNPSYLHFNEELPFQKPSQNFWQ